MIGYQGSLMGRKGLGAKAGCLLVILAAGGGCARIPASSPPVGFAREVEEMTVAGDPAERREAAAAFVSYSAPLAKQLAAFTLLQRIYEEDPADREAALLLARSALLLSGLLDEPEEKYGVIRKGFEAAAAAGGDGDEPEAAYYYGTHLGMLIEEKGLTASGELGRFEAALHRALARPETDQGGPLRVLGMLYLRAPAWPLGVGDLEAALDYLERAARDYPDYPENHIFFAYALGEAGRTGEARERLEPARRALEKGEWGDYAARWRAEIEKYGEELK